MASVDCRSRLRWTDVGHVLAARLEEGSNQRGDVLVEEES
jgi:hypothetical protein